jgi:hypothetical protein
VVACYNEHECCAIWAEVGECNENPLYMKVWCKVACDQCHPIYDSSLGSISVIKYIPIPAMMTSVLLDCVNRHRNCEFWAKAGECKNNQNWMFENCRQSCGHCGMTRQQVCRAGAITVGPTPKSLWKYRILTSWLNKF